MSIVTSIIKIIEEKAQQEGATKIVSIELRVGEVRDIHEDLLQRYFDWFSKGSIVEGAIVSMRKTPLVYVCSECNRSYHMDLSTMSATSDPARCEDHPDAMVEILSGTELVVENIGIIA